MLNLAKVWEIMVTKFGTFMQGVSVTLELALFTVLLSSLLGLLVAIFRRTRIWPLRILFNVYVAFIRSTPLLVQVLMIVYGLLAAFLFFMVHLSGGVSFDIPKMLLFVVLIFVLIVVHELIHGATWAIFSEHHWKDISFGFMVKTLTPYCTCKTPLGKWQYIAGALMPLILLGILPTVVAIASGSFLTLLLGIVMVAGAAGDILIVWKFLRHQVTGQEVLYIDHPTAAGSVVFER